ncbi:hypothetical protein JIN85_14540 [Luteolibacter pohnpeiensis]|uniref:Uncharacterized protein n=1 Tax=Luteolibacter pohnpeiensis TaxID=454153 RepID=A0A934S7J2_9BACT|nr:hypothetical protein [Luteolibacter pohnpeiensis]MBK1883637.1 hypothetical protein [Luteolibacter pohnpeiensis]
MFSYVRISLYVVAVLALVGSSACAKETPAHPEAWYRDEVARKLGGKTEVQVPNGRVDILTEAYAIEVEKATNWKEAIGQCLWYSLQTNKRAGIVLIVTNEKRDRGHIIRLGSVIQANELPIRVWIWPDDFENE